MVVPVIEMPVNDLAGRIIGCEVLLANGAKRWAMLGNIDPHDVESTKQFVDLGLFVDGEWLRLARYFDVDFERNGPDAFAKRLGLPVSEVFPISYDVTQFVTGERDALVGRIDRVPVVRLSNAERRKLMLR